MHGDAPWPTIEMNSKLSERQIEFTLDSASGTLHITHRNEKPGTPFYLAFSKHPEIRENGNWPTPLLRALFAASRFRGEPRVGALLGVAERLLPHSVRADLIAHAEEAARALPDQSARERWLERSERVSESWASLGDGPVPGDPRIADERFVMLRKSGKAAGAVADLRGLPFANKEKVRVIFKRVLPPEVAIAPDVLERSLAGLRHSDPAAADAWRAWLGENMAGHPCLQRILALLR
jgi:hypothetical protein